MKRRINQIIGIAAGVSILLATTIQADGAKVTVDDRNPFTEPILIRATCYTSDQGAITSSGQSVRTGTIAGKKEWEGCVALLYTYKIVDGAAVPDEMIGIYEVIDTGAGIDTDGDGKGDTIPSGQSIDVFQTDNSQVRQWINTYGDYVMMMLVKGKG